MRRSTMLGRSLMQQVSMSMLATRLVQRASMSMSATVLALGTAVPEQCIAQKNFPDFLFDCCGKENAELKAKFAAICDKSGVEKKYLTISKEFIKRNPCVSEYNKASLNARQELMKEEIPKLGLKAVMKAIQEWGRPVRHITHLVMVATGGVCAPGPDAKLATLLGLEPTTQRIMLFQQGCSGGGAALRLGKQLAEATPGARVLVVSSEVTASHFEAPNIERPDGLVISALLGDGAAALILGCDPDERAGERPLYRLHAAAQSLLPDSTFAVWGDTTEAGYVYHLSKELPNLVGAHVHQFLSKLMMEAREPMLLQRLYHRLLESKQKGSLQVQLQSHRHMHTQSDGGVDWDWEDMFWIMHPGGPAIMDKVQTRMNLDAHHLECSRRTLADYGNLASSTIFFVMDRMRTLSSRQGYTTTGLGRDLGIFLAFGPGLTFEAMLLESCPS